MFDIDLDKIDTFSDTIQKYWKVDSEFVLYLAIQPGFVCFSHLASQRKIVLFRKKLLLYYCEVWSRKVEPSK